MSEKPPKREFKAAIFDLDGLLIDSEPLWQTAEMEVFSGVGLDLTRRECMQTTGLRTEQVVAYWYERRPWDAGCVPSAEITERINQRVIELIGERGEVKDGVGPALDLVEALGLRLALASSSSMRVIDAALDRMGIAPRFEVIHSADMEARSKPAPDVYLGAARRLGVEPRRCVALEDSEAGLQAAKSAGMACIWVPERPWPSGEGSMDPAADLILGSLAALDEKAWRRLTTLPAAKSTASLSTATTAPSTGLQRNMR